MILSKMMMYFCDIAEANQLPASHPDYNSVMDFCFWFLSNKACVDEVVQASGMFHQMVMIGDDTNQDAEELIEIGHDVIIESVYDCATVYSDELEANQYIVEDMHYKYQHLIVEVIASCVFHNNHSEFTNPTAADGASDGDGCVYMWEDTKGAYKIGITRWSNRESRPKSCARNRGDSIVRCIYGKVKQARPHESALLNFGVKCYTDGDGYTEFRKLTKQEVEACVCYINSVSIEVDSSGWG